MICSQKLGNYGNCHYLRYFKLQWLACNVFPIILVAWVGGLNKQIVLWRHRKVASYLPVKERKISCKRDCHLPWEKSYVKPEIGQRRGISGWRSTVFKGITYEGECYTFQEFQVCLVSPELWVHVWKWQRRLDRRQWEDHDHTDLLRSRDFILRKEGKLWIILFLFIYLFYWHHPVAPFRSLGSTYNLLLLLKKIFILYWSIVD